MANVEWDPDTYLAAMLAEIPSYLDLQQQVAEATEGVEVSRVLELGVGTGETARRVLERHPRASWTAIDANEAMLGHAREALPRADLRRGRLEDPLPDGPFDLVVSSLAVHHLDGAGKRDLFRRVFDVLGPGGAFVLGDVFVPEDPGDVQIEIDSTISSNGWARPDSRPSLCGSTRILRSCGLAAGGFDDQLGTEAEEEPCEERPGDEDLGVDAPKNREELDDDVEDRAGRDRKERDLDPLVRPRLSDRGANEGRSAADHAEQGKKPPTRAFRVTCHGADDAEALGRVVGCEADHERDGKAHFACSGRLADRQAFGEVVDPDPGGDEQAEPLARREPGHPRAFELGGRGGAGTEQRLPALPGHPAVVVDEAHQAGDGAAPEQEAEPEQVTPFVFLGRLLHGLPAVGYDVEEEKEEDPCGKGHEDGLEPDVCVPVAAERQAEEDRHAGDPAEEKGLAAAHVRVTLQNLSGLRCARWRRGIPSTSTWRRSISWPFRSANTGP